MTGKNPWHDLSAGKNTPEIVNAIIEIPKDSKVKYELDKDSGMLMLDRFLYSAVHYPGDYGFIPQTLWEDGDPLDILILTGVPVYPMTLAETRVIGVLRMVDDGEKDDKILAVYKNDPRFAEMESIKDVPRHIIAELKHFFETYKQLQGKNAKILEILDKKDAFKSIELGKKLYDLKYRPDSLTNRE
ncbi:MAG: inorganic diphosphatase [Nanoarchaeota archaeon]|nr:inorganic diphosphatase [Nanoarchaeota archaeon]